MRDLMCDPSTLVGPVDPRVVAKIGKRYPLGTEFLACMKACHGGVPKIGTFKVGSKRGRIELFLTLLDEESKLPPPKRPHFADERMDERVINGISYLKDYEHATSRALFTGLLPFAALLADMFLDRAYVDLLCLDYRTNRDDPPVVLWLSHQANRAYMAWDRLPLKDQFDENEAPTSVPWDDFLTLVAPNFAAFVEGLEPLED